MASISVPFVLSPEQLGSQIQLATVDAVIEKALLDLVPAVPPEMVGDIANAVLADPGHNLALAAGRSIGQSLQFGAIDVTDIINDVKMVLREIEKADDKLQAFAAIILEISTRWAISVELLLTKLAQRIVRLRVASCVVPGFNICGAKDSVAVSPSELSVSVSLAPQVGAGQLDLRPLDVARVLIGLLEMQVTVDAKYGVTATSGDQNK